MQQPTNYRRIFKTYEEYTQGYNDAFQYYGELRDGRFFVVNDVLLDVVTCGTEMFIGFYQLTDCCDPGCIDPDFKDWFIVGYQFETIKIGNEFIIKTLAETLATYE